MQDQLAQAMAALPADPLPAATAITDTDAANFLADFDMFSGLGSLGALDAEFGDSGPTTVEQMAAEEKSRTARCEPDTTLDGSQPVDSGKVAIWAVAIGWPSSSAAGAPVALRWLLPLTTEHAQLRLRSRG